MQKRLEPEQLIDRISAIVDERGLTTLTLENLALKLDLTLDEISECYESKEALVVALIARSRARQRAAFARIDADRKKSAPDRARAVWRYFLDNAADSRLIFESFAIGMRDEHYRAFVHGVDDWLDVVESAPARDRGPHGNAIAFATLALAVHRGAMMDVCATGDRSRVNSAIDLWIQATASETVERDA